VDVLAALVQAKNIAQIARSMNKLAHTLYSNYHSVSRHTDHESNIFSRALFDSDNETQVMQSSLSQETVLIGNCCLFSGRKSHEFI
jgi:hypothetical protein